MRGMDICFAKSVEFAFGKRRGIMRHRRIRMRSLQELTVLHKQTTHTNPVVGASIARPRSSQRPRREFVQTPPSLPLAHKGKVPSTARRMRFLRLRRRREEQATTIGLHKPIILPLFNAAKTDENRRKRVDKNRDRWYDIPQENRVSLRAVRRGRQEVCE